MEDRSMQDSMESASALLSRLAQHEIIAFVPRTEGAASASAHEDEFMTTQELARLLRVDPSSVRRWRTSVPAQGPPYVRISGRVVKYRRADVDRWLAGRRVDPEVA
jgi:excisionase family DNA binding protein